MVKAVFGLNLKLCLSRSKDRVSRRVLGELLPTSLKASGVPAKPLLSFQYPAKRHYNRAK